MRIFTAAIVTETNTFSPLPAGRQSFEVQHGNSAPIRATHSDFVTMVRWVERGREDGHTVIESIAAVAEPAGLTVRPVYESMRDELLEDLARALPIDIVLLYLHGAMVAQGYDDCEGDILARVRSIAGRRTIIGAELDPHSHLTPEMLQHANVIVAYDEYPHTDIIARGEDLYRLCTAAARGEIRPVMRAFDCRMTGLYPTTSSPMRELVDDLKSMRGGALLSTSIVHGFPWGDVEHAGTKTLAIADGDETLAQKTAQDIGERMCSMREALQLKGMSIDQALDAAAKIAQKPVVLADVADNAGGGAPGDATYVLERLLQRNIAGAVSGVYYDPVAVQLCFEAGEGASIDLRIGGKLGPASGDPVDVRVTVRGLCERHEQDSMDDSAPAALGRSVWVDAGGVQLVLASVRSQVFAPNAFTGLGIDLDGAQIVVVKSSHHFWGKFAPIAGAIFYVDSPGALQLDFAHIPYRKRRPDYWPRQKGG